MGGPKGLVRSALMTHFSIFFDTSFVRPVRFPRSAKYGNNTQVRAYSNEEFILMAQIFYKIYAAARESLLPLFFQLKQNQTDNFSI